MHAFEHLKQVNRNVTLSHDRMQQVLQEVVARLQELPRRPAQAELEDLLRFIQKSKPPHPADMAVRPRSVHDGRDT